MPIPVKCACGKKFSLKDELAGRKVKCPACQQVLSVPKPQVVEEPDEPWEVDDDFDEDVALAKSKRGKKSASGGTKSKKGKKGKKQSDSSLGLIIGLAAGGGLLVVGLLVWLLLPGKPAENVAGNPAGAGAGAKTAADSAAGSGGPTASTPQMPRALSQLPDWLAQDAPFDVKQYWITVPADQNAAPLYLDALYEFSHVLEACFPPDVRAARTPAIKARYERSEKLQIAWGGGQQPKNPAERDAVLQEHEAAFQKLAAAQQRPQCVFDIGWDPASQVPLFHAVREVLRVAQLQAERDIERGDLTSVVKLTGSMLRLSRDLRPRAPMTMQAIANAADAMITANLVIPSLKSPKLTVAQCDELMQLLTQHDAALRSIDPFLTGVRGDHIAKRMLMHDLQHQSGEFAEDKFKQAFGATNATRGAALMSALNNGMEQFGMKRPEGMQEKLIDILLAEMKPAHYAECEALLKEKFQILTSGTSQPYSARSKAFNEFTTKLQLQLQTLSSEAPKAASNLPPEQQGELFAKILKTKVSEGMSPAPILFFLLWSQLENGLEAAGDLVLIDVQRSTHRQATMALVALRRWYGTHAEPPPDIATVSREAGLADVPRDAFGDGPLKLATFPVETPLQGNVLPNKVLAGESVIYSVSGDGVDDKALTSNVGYARNPGDWLFQLEIPQNAIPVTPGQPAKLR